MTSLSISKWLKEHYKELQNKYPDKYIAIQNEKILAAGDTIEEVYIRARSLSSRLFILEFIKKSDIFLYES